MVKKVLHKAIEKVAKKEKTTSAKSYVKTYGAILFILGIAIVLISPLFSLEATAQKVILATLILLGLIIGFMNISNNETTEFIVAAMALVMLSGPFLGVISQTLISQATIMTYISEVFSGLISLVAPAAIVAAIKAIVITAKDEE